MRPERVSYAKKVLIQDEEREVHRVGLVPAWVQPGFVSPQAFLPRPQDKGSLSALDKGCSAAEALDNWNSRFKPAPCVLTVTVAQARAQALSVYDDSPEGAHHVAIEADDPGLWELAAEELARLCAVHPRP